MCYSKRPSKKCIIFDFRLFRLSSAIFAHAYHRVPGTVHSFGRCPAALWLVADSRHPPLLNVVDVYTNGYDNVIFNIIHDRAAWWLRWRWRGVATQTAQNVPRLISLNLLWLFRIICTIDQILFNSVYHIMNM